MQKKPCAQVPKGPADGQPSALSLSSRQRPLFADEGPAVLLLP